jgi:hypothetical protein
MDQLERFFSESHEFSEKNRAARRFSEKDRAATRGACHPTSSVVSRRRLRNPTLRPPL